MKKRLLAMMLAVVMAFSLSRGKHRYEYCYDHGFWRYYGSEL